MGDVYAKKSTATVYKSTNGRRYLTKRGAFMGSARHSIDARLKVMHDAGDECDCSVSGCDWQYVTTCRYHERDGKLFWRLVRWMKWRDSRAEDVARG